MSRKCIYELIEEETRRQEDLGWTAGPFGAAKDEREFWIKTAATIVRWLRFSKENKGKE